MRINTILIVLSLIYFSPGVWAFSRTFDLPDLKFSPYRLQFATDIHHFQSGANFNSNGGEFSKLTGGRTYKNSVVTLKSSLDFSRKLSTSVDLGFARAESYDGSFTRTNTSVTEVIGGLKYNLIRSSWRLTASLLFGFPFNRIDESTDEVLTGEGAMFLEPGAWASFNALGLKNYFYLGGRYRDQGRASLAVYRAGSIFIGRSILVGAEVGGHSTILDDEYINDPSQRTDVTDQVNGGSLRFYSVNPALLEAGFWVGARITRSLMGRVGYAQGINGENSAQGFTVFASISIATSLKNLFGGPEKKTHEFEVDSKGYDPRLFERSKPRRQKRRQ